MVRVGSSRMRLFGIREEDSFRETGGALVY